MRKLGTSVDAKNFVYNHGGNTVSPLGFTQPTNIKESKEKKSLINASKLPYDPITHVMTFDVTDRWQNARRLAPFSKETHLGRFNAPNYSK
jgi:hypothetical protein